MHAAVPLDYNVVEFGAVGDGATSCTTAIQRTIDACAEAGGGRVVLPAGTFVSGPVFLKSNIELHLSAGATLLGATAFTDYPVIAGRWEGIERDIHAALVTGLDAANVSITGTGVIDGRGKLWWDAARKTNELRKKQGITEREPPNPPGAPLQYPRPRLIYLQNCRGVRITGVTVKDSPSWTIHPVYCDDVVIDGVTITAPEDSPNTDGIDPDSCRNVRIANCRIGCGDDCIIIKSGYNADGRRVNRPSENITITNCTLGPGVAAVGIGSETSGGVRDVTVSNCVFVGTANGLRVKSARGRGAFVENFRATNIVMRDMREIALSITTYYDSRDDNPRPVDETTPTFRRLHWSNLIIDGAERAGVFEGLPERFLEDIRCDAVTARRVERGLSFRFVDGLHLGDVSIDVDQDPPVVIKHSRALELVAVSTRRPSADEPLLSLTDVQDATIRACRPPRGTGAFLRLDGRQNAGIVLQGNALERSSTPTAFVDGATADAVKILR